MGFVKGWKGQLTSHVVTIPPSEAPQDLLKQRSRLLVFENSWCREPLADSSEQINLHIMPNVRYTSRCGCGIMWTPQSQQWIFYLVWNHGSLISHKAGWTKLVLAFRKIVIQTLHICETKCKEGNKTKTFSIMEAISCWHTKTSPACLFHVYHCWLQQVPRYSYAM